MFAGRVASVGNYKRFCSPDSAVPEYSIDSSDARLLHFGHQRADVEVRQRDRAVFQGARFLERDFWRDHHFLRQLVIERILSRQ